jgi:hypothetical protein
MSVYVGIYVHRKRSQVAVVDQVGQVLTNRNVPNGVEAILQVIGDLPIGTPAKCLPVRDLGLCTSPVPLQARHFRASTPRVPKCRVKGAG